MTPEHWFRAMEAGSQLTREQFAKLLIAADLDEAETNQVAGELAHYLHRCAGGALVSGIASFVEVRRGHPGDEDLVAIHYRLVGSALIVVGWVWKVMDFVDLHQPWADA